MMQTDSSEVEQIEKIDTDSTQSSSMDDPPVKKAFRKKAFSASSDQEDRKSPSASLSSDVTPTKKKMTILDKNSSDSSF